MTSGEVHVKASWSAKNEAVHLWANGAHFSASVFLTLGNARLLLNELKAAVENGTGPTVAADRDVLRHG